MVTLIHNVLTTDYVTLIHDDDCVMGLELIERRGRLLERVLRLRKAASAAWRACSASRESATSSARFAWRAISNLGAGDNVVTIATDGFDRYPSVLADLERRRGPQDEATLAGSFEQIFRGCDPRDILDVRPRAEAAPL